jgi:hypothetical protein
MPSLRTLGDRLLCSPGESRETLQAWCDDFLPPAGRITAEKRRDVAARPIGDVAADRLWRQPPERLEARNLRLVRRGSSLCEIDSWFIPDRLTPEICASLRRSELPFGMLAADLGPTRRIFFARFRFPPDASVDRWREMLTPDTIVLEQESLISDCDDFPLCVAHERYFATLLPDVSSLSKT